MKIGEALVKTLEITLNQLHDKKKTTFILTELAHLEGYILAFQHIRDMVKNELLPIENGNGVIKE